MPQVLVLGDDLTGSNATGALFARFGLRTVSVSAPLTGAPPADVDALVVNLGTRHATPRRACAAVREVLGAVEPVRLLVKRVDTTLRGNVGAEADAALATRPPGTRALVVPAFPDAGRVTVGGLHLVDGVPLAETPAARDPLTPVTSSRVATLLRAGCTRPVCELPLDVVESGVHAVVAALSESDGELIVCDATRNTHLTTIAEAAARTSTQDGAEWVSVDSGPFGARLAAALGITAQARAAGPAPPVLAVVGSITDLTRDQVLETEQVLQARYVDVPPGRADTGPVVERVCELIDAGHRVVGIRTCDPHARAHTHPDPVLAGAIPGTLTEITRTVLRNRRVGGLYATGGDIAAALTDGLGTDGFEIDTEVLPLAVAGHLVGGEFHGLPFATKGGLIGDRTAAVACLEYLNTVIARLQRGHNA